jgi:peptidyl-prolyl cis-trans isomerase B (cyclophilin B)
MRRALEGPARRAAFPRAAALIIALAASGAAFHSGTAPAWAAEEGSLAALPGGGSGAEAAALLLVELVEARGEPADGPRLLEALSSPFARVRARAALAAGRCGQPLWNRPQGGSDPLGEPLRSLLFLARSDPEPVAREQAIFALGQVADPAVSAGLALLAIDPLPSIRARAVEALGKIPGTGAALLLPSLDDPDPSVRGAAALAIARLPVPLDPDGRELVGSAVAARLDGEKDPGVIWRLHYLLSRRTELMSAHWLRARSLAALGSPNFLAAAYAAQALAANPGRESGAGGRAVETAAALGRLASDPRGFWIARSSAERGLARLFPQGGPPPRGRALPAGLGAAPAEGRRLLNPGCVLAEVGPAAFFPAAVLGHRRDPRVTITVRGRGQVRLEFWLSRAPQSAAQLGSLLRAGRFDGQPFRAVSADPGAVGARPEAMGAADRSGGPRPEPGPEPFLRGSVGLDEGRRSRGEIGFFIASLPLPELEGRATQVGSVVAGMEVVDRIQAGDAIESVTVEGFPE